MHLYQTYLVGMQQKQPQLLQEDTIVSYLNEQIDAKQMSSHKKYVCLSLAILTFSGDTLYILYSSLFAL
jgi:hypothetical protein